MHKKNCQIFKDACQQMERMLVTVADAPAVALEIISGLTNTYSDDSALMCYSYRRAMFP
jgi:hypothetical protein